MLPLEFDINESNNHLNLLVVTTQASQVIWIFISCFYFFLLNGLESNLNLSKMDLYDDKSSINIFFLN